MRSLGHKYYCDKLVLLLPKTSLLDVIGMTESAWAMQNRQPAWQFSG